MIFSLETKCIGLISKPHGVQGDVILRAEEPIGQIPEHLFIEIDGGQVPFKIIDIRETVPDQYIVSFDCVRTEQEARAIQSKSVFIETCYCDEEEEVVDDCEGCAYVGYLLLDQHDMPVGIIEECSSEIPGNPLFVIKERDLLIPYHSDLIISVSESSRQIVYQIHEGLLAL